jgi:tRNA dimethylallyltransferase
MFAEGLMDEIADLLAAGYGDADPGLKGIGYREIMELRKKGCGTVAETVSLVQRNSRRYAKRQRTFFRRFPGIHWFHPDRRDGLRDCIAEFTGPG